MFQERNNRVGYGNYSNMLCRLISNLGFFLVERDFLFENSHVLKYATVILKNKFCVLKLLKIESEVFH